MLDGIINLGRCLLSYSEYILVERMGMWRKGIRTWEEACVEGGRGRAAQLASQLHFFGQRLLKIFLYRSVYVQGGQ
jgi:hypothetical protein